jgi:hypothetical protein
MKCELFSDDFKNLWSDDPKKNQYINSLEVFYLGLKEMAQIEEQRQYNLTDISDINKEFRKILEKKEILFVNKEIIPKRVNYLFNRITLRTQLKIIDAMQLLFFSCNNTNAYGCVLASRSIIENVAAYQYLISNIPWKIDKTVNTKDATQFLKLLDVLGFGSRFNWDMLHSDFRSIRESFESGTHKWNRPKERRIPEIVKFNDNLDKTLFEMKQIKQGEIFFIYTVLSDIIHPSAGGDFIYSQNMYKKLEVNGQLNENFKRLFLFAGIPNVALVRHFILLCQEIHKYDLQQFQLIGNSVKIE